MFGNISDDNTVGITCVHPSKVFHHVGMNQKVGSQLLLPDGQHHGHGGSQDVLHLHGGQLVQVGGLVLVVQLQPVPRTALLTYPLTGVTLLALGMTLDKVMKMN